MIGVTTGAGAALAGAFGLLLGSFLNVVAYRLPRGESLAVPASRCPGCDTPIKPYDNVPVLSWLLLRGRCRSCGTRIAWRYPLVELVTALLLALTVVVIGPNEDVWLGIAFVLLLVPVTVIDLDYRIIPNKLMIAGTVVALAILALTSPDDDPRAPDRGRGGRRLPARRGDRVPVRHGHGRRQARVRHGPVPRPRGGRGDARARSSPGRSSASP